MERLEKIKKSLKSKNQNEWLTFEDIEWLIKQAEKLEEIENKYNDVGQRLFNYFNNSNNDKI